jgi:hypothetical protein
MRSTLILFILLFTFSLSSIGQVYNTAFVPDKVKRENVTEYIIGIGNQDKNIFLSVFEDLKTDAAINIYAVCETNRIFGISVQNSEYKSYDEVRDNLINMYPDILLFRKNNTIFSKDCKDEILKQ